LIPVLLVTMLLAAALTGDDPGAGPRIVDLRPRRRYLAALLLVPLAITSNRWSMRRFGSDWK